MIRIEYRSHKKTQTFAIVANGLADLAWQLERMGFLDALSDEDFPILSVENLTHPKNEKSHYYDSAEENRN